MNSASSDIEKVREFLRRRRFVAVEAVRPSQSRPDTVIVEIAAEKLAHRADRFHTSARQLARLGARLSREIGVQIDWRVLEDSQRSRIERGLADVLKAKYPDAVLSVTLASAPASSKWRAYVKLDPTAEGGAEGGAVEELVNRFFAALEIKVTVEVETEEERIPSEPAILRCLKVHSPATLGELRAALVSDGWKCPDERGLSTRLDTLRRRGLAVHLGAKRYALSDRGLRAVPAARTSSGSDVQRALVLGRRRWQ